MGVSRIEYRPWKGDRTDPKWRLLVISRFVFVKNMKAASVIAILVIGIFIAHFFPIIETIFIQHEEVTDDFMIGMRADLPDPPDQVDDHYETVGLLLTKMGQKPRVSGNYTINGTVMIQGTLELKGYLRGTGHLQGTPDVVKVGAVEEFGSIGLVGIVFLENGSIEGDGFIEGNFILSGNGTINGTVSDPGPSMEQRFQDGYLTGYLLLMFTMLLAAIVCSDIIADDLNDSSFVLYFSRPVKAFDYLVGKMIGLAWVMGIFCFLLPLIYVIVLIGTQTGNDYSNGLRVFGLTFIAGIVTALFYLPYGLMMSSLTKRKAYAGIGVFVSFFVLLIVAGLFTQFNDKWMLIDPFQVLTLFYVFLFGGNAGADISGPEVAASLFVFTFIPMVIVYYMIHRKGVGK